MHSVIYLIKWDKQLVTHRAKMWTDTRRTDVQNVLHNDHLKDQANLFLTMISYSFKTTIIISKVVLNPTT